MPQKSYEETTIAAVAINRFQQYGDKQFLTAMYQNGETTTDWKSYSFHDLESDIHRMVCAWNILGVKSQSKVAIMGKNRPRWIQTALSLFINNITMVTVYPTLKADDAAYILKDSNAEYIVVDTLKQAKKILTVKSSLPNLKKIYVMDPCNDIPDKEVYSYDTLLKNAKGNENLQSIFDRVSTIDPEDIAVIIYTSGTTGPPKGVMLTNNNLMNQRIVLPYFNLNTTDVFLNHLPLSHSFGLVTDFLASINAGARMAIATGFAAEEIRHALTSIRPTVLMSVPRLFEKLYGEVQRVVLELPERGQKLFNKALEVGKQIFDLKNENQQIPQILSFKYYFARIIINRIKRKAGLDRVRVAFAGGGPVSRDLCYFFQSLGIEIFQGYGLTETSPICAVNIPGKNKLGSVGQIIEGVDLKIAEDGEILIKGHNLMKGYHNRPDATAEAVDTDGWFHTGDIGTLDKDGFLSITDRKKELIITSGGKNIAPLSIESAYTTEQYIEQLILIGENRKYLTALVSPNFRVLSQWALDKNLQWKSNNELTSLPEVVELIENRVADINNNFASFEQIKKITIVDHEFSEMSGELTPTHKIKRKIVNTMYTAEINSMYSRD